MSMCFLNNTLPASDSEVARVLMTLAILEDKILVGSAE